MPRRIAFATAASFLAHLLWATRLVFGATPLTARAAGLVALDLVVFGVIGTVAVLLGRTPWSRRIALGSLAVGGGGAALAHEIDLLWAIAAAVTAAAVLALAPSPGRGWYMAPRGQPVPAGATGVAIGLAVVPGLVGVTGVPEVRPLGFGLALLGLVLAFTYARAKLWALWAARAGVPLLAIGAAIGLEVWAALVLVAGSWLVSGLAWAPVARNAAAPLSRRETAVPILPEMVPPDVLEAAGFDQRGRPKDRR